MRVLALDTTTPAGSVALVEGGRLVDERVGDRSRPHAERLPGDIVALVEACGIRLSEIDLFAVASGPGSFTGLRIGIATIQGLAFVSRKCLVGISALEALAQIASLGLAPGAVVAAWMDAHRREVFTALYRVTSTEAFEPDHLEEIEAAAVGDPSETLARCSVQGKGSVATFVGDGAALYEGIIRREAGEGSAIIGPPPLAGALGRLAIARAGHGAPVDPAGIRPLYVRRPDAEVARDASR
jgi:tRNA threonylcarbamoyladenosine biosynthesis protein TsaB